VTKDVPAFAIVAGTPARVVRMRKARKDRVASDSEDVES